MQTVPFLGPRNCVIVLCPFQEKVYGEMKVVALEKKDVLKQNNFSLQTKKGQYMGSQLLHSHGKSGQLFEIPLFSRVEWRILQLSEFMLKLDFRVYTHNFLYMRPQ